MCWVRCGHCRPQLVATLTHSSTHVGIRNFSPGASIRQGTGGLGFETARPRHWADPLYSVNVDHTGLCVAQWLVSLCRQMTAACSVWDWTANMTR